MPMKNPPHPGRIVRQECLEPLGLSVTDGAKALGVSRNALSELVNERRGISPEMAIRLDKAFGSTAEAWAGIQFDYDMARALKHADEIKVERVATPPFRAIMANVEISEPGGATCRKSPSIWTMTSIENKPSSAPPSGGPRAKFLAGIAYSVCSQHLFFEITAPCELPAPF